MWVLQGFARACPGGPFFWLMHGLHTRQSLARQHNPDFRKEVRRQGSRRGAESQRRLDCRQSRLEISGRCVVRGPIGIPALHSASVRSLREILIGLGAKSNLTATLPRLRTEHDCSPAKPLSRCVSLAIRERPFAIGLCKLIANIPALPRRHALPCESYASTLS